MSQLLLSTQARNVPFSGRLETGNVLLNIATSAHLEVSYASRCDNVR